MKLLGGGNATSLDETLLYSGSKDNLITSYADYNLLDSVFNYDYILVEMRAVVNVSSDIPVGNDQIVLPIICRHPSAYVDDLQQFDTFPYYSNTHNNGDRVFSGGVRFMGANGSVIRVFPNIIGSSVVGAYLSKVIGIKKNSLSTADIAEMAMPSEVALTVNSGDTVSANGWLNVGIKSSADNGSIEIKISNSGVDRYENIRVIGSNLWTAHSFAIKKGSTITFNLRNSATLGWSSLSYSVGDAKALGLI